MKTLFIGQKIIHLKAVDSTNNYAAGLLRQSVIYEGTIVIAEFQQKGKGQRGNHWESEPGKNLTFSIILNPSFLRPEQQFLLNKIISVAISDFLKSLGMAGVSIKWPNDILVDRKKIAGILIENTIRANEIIHSIIGIGLNVNQAKFNSAMNAISLKIILKKIFHNDKILEELCSFIESEYLKLRENTTAADKKYLQSLFQLSEWKDYQLKGERISARITGVTSSGLLILQDEKGGEINCNLKEVVFL